MTKKTKQNKTKALQFSQFTCSQQVNKTPWSQAGRSHRRPKATHRPAAAALANPFPPTVLLEQTWPPRLLNQVYPERNTPNTPQGPAAQAQRAARAPRRPPAAQGAAAARPRLTGRAAPQPLGDAPQVSVQCLEDVVQPLQVLRGAGAAARHGRQPPPATLGDGRRYHLPAAARHRAAALKALPSPAAACWVPGTPPDCKTAPRRRQRGHPAAACSPRVATRLLAPPGRTRRRAACRDRLGRGALTARTACREL